MNGINLSDHFPACFIALTMTGLFAELLNNAFTGRSIFQCEFRYDFAKAAWFRIANLLRRHAQPQQELAESKRQHGRVETH